MDIQAEKLELIQWIVGVNDLNIINEFIALKKSKESDWWDELSAEEQAEIHEGLSQADNGNVIPHEKVMEKYKKWL
jgi:hypothetical protein